MNHSYIEGHKASGIKVGDTVKIMRKPKGYEGGWKDHCVSGMDSMVGNLWEVTEDCGEAGFRCGQYVFPYSVLQKVAAIEPEKVEPADEPWKPETGEECLLVNDDQTAIHVDVWATHGKQVWVGRHGDPKDTSGMVQHETWLHPLPLDLPVKEGDYLEVRWKHEPDRVAFVGRVKQTSHNKVNLYGSEAWFPVEQVILTKLVPAQSDLYDKMKRRLEEMRDNSKRLGLVREQDTCEELLANLEVYAKEVKPC